MTSKSIAAFYIRRIFRILPMYWFYVVVFGLIFEKGKSYIIGNMFYFKGEDQLWTISQELLFYLIMPAIAFCIAPIRSRLPFICCSALLVAAYLSTKYLTYDVIRLPALTGATMFFLSPFLCGAAAAVALPQTQIWIGKISSPTSRYASLALLLLICAPHAYAAYIYGPGAVNLESQYSFVMALSFAVLLVWISSFPKNWIVGVLGFPPLRMIGTVGFSVYLLHTAVLTAFNGTFAPWHAFLFMSGITIGCAAITYLLIERPGIKIGNKLARAIMATERAEKHRASIVGLAPSGEPAEM